MFCPIKTRLRATLTGILQARAMSSSKKRTRSTLPKPPAPSSCSLMKSLVLSFCRGFVESPVSIYVDRSPPMSASDDVGYKTTLDISKRINLYNRRNIIKIY